MTRIASVLSVVLLVALTASCSSSKDAAKTDHAIAATTTTTRATNATSTTTTLPYSFDGSIPPPPLVNTGNDYAAIINSLLAYSDWLYAARPDVSLINNVAASGSKSEKAHLHDLPILASTDHRAIEHLSGPTRVVVISAQTGSVSARVTQEIAYKRVFKRDGSVFQNVDLHASATTYLVVIARFPNGPWQLVSVDEQK